MVYRFQLFNPIDGISASCNTESTNGADFRSFRSRGVVENRYKQTGREINDKEREGERCPTDSSKTTLLYYHGV